MRIMSRRPRFLRSAVFRLRISPKLQTSLRGRRPALHGPIFIGSESTSLRLLTSRRRLPFGFRHVHLHTTGDPVAGFKTEGFLQAFQFSLQRGTGFLRGHQVSAFRNVFQMPGCFEG